MTTKSDYTNISLPGILHAKKKTDRSAIILVVEGVNGISITIKMKLRYSNQFFLP